MNLVEGVLTFAFITALFEFVCLMKIKPRTRLRMLGSKYVVISLHLSALLCNLYIHFGTLVGSMTAVTAALASFATIPLIRWYSGYVTNGIYHPGIKKYPVELLR